MIEKDGLSDAIKFFGGYGRISRLVGDKFSKDIMINYVKQTVGQICDGYDSDGFSTSEFYISPIEYASTLHFQKQIEYFNRDSVYVDVYDDNDKHIGDELVKYIDLPDDVLERVFEEILSIDIDNYGR